MDESLDRVQVYSLSLQLTRGDAGTTVPVFVRRADGWFVAELGNGENVTANTYEELAKRARTKLRQRAVKVEVPVVLVWAGQAQRAVAVGLHATTGGVLYRTTDGKSAIKPPAAGFDAVLDGTDVPNDVLQRFVDVRMQVDSLRREEYALRNRYRINVAERVREAIANAIGDE